MIDLRLRQRVNENEAGLQALKEYVKLLFDKIEMQQKRIVELEQRVMEDDGK